MVPEELTAAGELSRLVGPGPVPDALFVVPEPGTIGILVPPQAPAVGRSLAALDLRAGIDASVLAGAWSPGEAMAPSGKEALAAVDRLGLVGAREAVERARSLLLDPEPAG